MLLNILFWRDHADVWDVSQVPSIKKNSSVNIQYFPILFDIHKVICLWLQAQQHKLSTISSKIWLRFFLNNIQNITLFKILNNGRLSSFFKFVILNNHLLASWGHFQGIHSFNNLVCMYRWRNCIHLRK